MEIKIGQRWEAKNPAMIKTYGYSTWLVIDEIRKSNLGVLIIKAHGDPAFMGKGPKHDQYELYQSKLWWLYKCVETAWKEKPLNELSKAELIEMIQVLSREIKDMKQQGKNAG